MRSVFLYHGVQPPGAPSAKWDPAALAAVTGRPRVSLFLPASDPQRFRKSSQEAPEGFQEGVSRRDFAASADDRGGGGSWEAAQGEDCKEEGKGPVSLGRVKPVCA